MTNQKYALDGGADGAAISTGNTGASVLSGCTGIFSSAAKGFGNVGVRLTIAAGANPAFRFPGAAADNHYGFWFMSSGPMGADLGTVAYVPFATFRRLNGTNATIRWNKVANLYEILEGTSGANILTSFTPISLSTKYVYWLDLNNPSNPGAWVVKAYKLSDQSLAHSATGTTSWTSNAAFTDLQFGGSSDVQVTQDVDYLQILNGTVVEPPWPTNTLPTVTLTANQTRAPGETAVITATAGDSDGTIASYAFSIAYANTTTPALTGANTSQLSFPVGATKGVLYVVSCTVTDDQGGQATATTEVRVPTTDDTVLPLPGSLAGASSWSTIGSQTDHGVILGDGNAGTLVKSPDLSGTASEEPIRLAPMSQRSNVTVTVGGAILTAAISHTSKIRVYCGPSTLIKEGDLPATVTGTAYTLALNEADCATITDWGDVRIRAVAKV